jgi:nicotinate-nucleotide adenylyltransferase
VRVGIYGGSFDPPHVGHALVCGWVLWTGLVDRVLLVPTFLHAFEKQLRPFEERLRLCAVLAGEVDPRVGVEPIERDLPTPSFTLRTLRALAARRPADALRLVVGADVLLQADHWHRWEDVQREFAPIVVGREGYPPVEGAPTFPGISSTEVRRRLAAGAPVGHLLTAGVRAALGVGG